MEMDLIVDRFRRLSKWLTFWFWNEILVLRWCDAAEIIMEDLVFFGLSWYARGRAATLASLLRTTCAGQTLCTTFRLKNNTIIRMVPSSLDR